MISVCVCVCACEGKGIDLLGSEGQLFAGQLVFDTVRLIGHGGLDGMLSAEIPNTVELSQTGTSDEKVDRSERIVDRSDDERVSNPDHARSCERHVLRDRDLVSRS